jgi:hypothetical protein
MSEHTRSAPAVQSQFTDDFLYYFLRVRKQRAHKVVKRLKDQYPGETREQLARRLIDAKSHLSFIGGTLTHLPMVVPGLGSAIKFLGVVGGTSVMTRMHLALILEIAVIYGKDLDDPELVPEIAVVVATVGAGTAAPFLIKVLELNPLYALPAAGVSASMVTRIVGENAVRQYSKAVPEIDSLREIPSPEPDV